MKEAIDSRFLSLMLEGDRLLATIPADEFGSRDRQYWLPTGRLSEYQQWMASASNLMKIIAKKGSHFFTEPDRLLARKNDQDGLQSSRFAELLGTFKAAHAEWEHGLLREIEYVVAAATFDGFLDHAAEFHKANKKIEASILVSAVLEDTIKRIASKNAVSPAGSLDPLIDRLTAADVFTLVKAKRVKAYAGLRNRAVHAEWDEFDIKDVGDAIDGVRELLEHYL